MRRKQINEFAWRTDIDDEDLLSTDNPAAQPKGYRLKFTDQERLGIALVQLAQPYLREDVFHREKLIAVLLKQVIAPQLCEQSFRLLQSVKGSPSNRPGIIGEKARQQGVRASDGKLSPRVRVPKAVMQKYAGKADMLGYYRYRAPARCDITNWTREKPELYRNVRPFIQAVDKTYRSFLPEEHARQMEYVNTIPERWRIPGTAFTTLYVLKNAPTATHVDDFDYPQGFGCMASLGEFRGGWICFPRYRIAVDYQPGDLLLADVHEVHANFPIYEGDTRVACIFFCRKDQHKCPA